jgi:hypothetical protein
MQQPEKLWGCPIDPGADDPSSCPAEFAVWRKLARSEI